MVVVENARRGAMGSFVYIEEWGWEGYKRVREAETGIEKKRG